MKTIEELARAKACEIIGRVRARAWNRAVMRLVRTESTMTASEIRSRAYDACEDAAETEIERFRAMGVQV